MFLNHLNKNALQSERRNIWDKLLLRKDSDPEFLAYLPRQLFYKGSNTFKLLSGQPLLHLKVHLLLSADNISLTHAHTHTLSIPVCITLKDSNRFWIVITYSDNVLHFGKLCQKPCQQKRKDCFIWLTSTAKAWPPLLLTLTVEQPIHIH